MIFRELGKTSIILLLLIFLGILSVIQAEDNALTPDYILGPEDQLTITVWQHQDLSMDVIIGPDGKISYPLIGDLKISGLTRSQAQESLTSALKKYLTEPKVNVSIIGYNSTRVKVLGMVNSPGLYSLRGKNTLVQAIAQAGGTANAAQMRYVTILRGPDRVLEVDLYKILYEGKIDLDVSLEPGDTIFVPDNRNTRAYVLGYVNQPGLIDINQRLTVLEAIMHSGGYTEGANLSDVWVVRGNIDKPEILHVNVEKQIKRGIIPKNHELKPGDIVYVHKGLVAKINYILDQSTPALRTIILGDSAYNALKGSGGSSQVVTPVQ